MDESSRVGTEVKQAICISISGVLQCVYRFEWSLIIGTGCDMFRSTNEKKENKKNIKQQEFRILRDARSNCDIWVLYCYRLLYNLGGKKQYEM